MIVQTPLQWTLDHIALIGWPTLIAVCWVFRGRLDAFLRRLEADRKINSEIHATTNELKASMDVLSSNHLFHIEKDMAELNGKQSDTLKCLQSMDTSLKILVDRGVRL